MADPLTALIHAVQVMNFLKTLILKALREREELAANARMLSSTCLESPSGKDDPIPLDCNTKESHEPTKDANATEPPATNKLMRLSTLGRMESNVEEKLWISEEKGNNADDGEFVCVSGDSTPSQYSTGALQTRYRRKYDSEHWLRLRKGVRKLCRHPVFQLSKPNKKPASVGIVNNRGRGGDAWA